jgi:hypothetical protein
MKKLIPLRNTLIVMAIMIATGLFIYFDPFHWIIPDGYLRPHVEPDLAQELGLELEEHAIPAGVFLLQQVQQHRIIYLSELGGIAQEPLFLANNLEDLVFQAGLEQLGLHILRAEDQVLIDQLMEAESFDEEFAKRLLFQRSVVWGYQEYLAIIRQAWQVNNRRPGALRVIGLQIRQDFSQILTQQDLQDPAKLRTLMNNGIPDRRMAEHLLEFLNPEQPKTTLLFVLREQTFPQIDLPLYVQQMEGLGFSGEVQFARLIYQAGFTQSVSLTFHSPWPSNQTRNRSEFPADGAIDAALDLWEESNRSTNRGNRNQSIYPIGFLFQGPFSALPIQRSLFNFGFSGEGADTLLLGQSFDGTIVLDRIHRLTAAQVIPNFITQENLSQAIQWFPGPTPAQAQPNEVMTFIRRFAENRERIVKEFR